MEIASGIVAAPAGDGLADPPSLLAPVAATPNLGVRTTAGFGWVFLQTIIGKFAGILTQIVLGKLLLKDDFAVVGYAYVITAFAGIIQDAGLSQILIHRQRKFALWSNAVNWMSLSAGLMTGVIVACSGPIAARVYAAPSLVPVLLVLSVWAPISSLSVVPMARLQADLRFKLIAAVQTQLTLLTAVLTVLFAWLGFGPYAIVGPPILGSLLRAAIFWSIARPPLRPTPQFGRWRYIVGDSAFVLASSFFITITMQADNLILGAVAAKDVFASYYFGFNLAFQVTTVLAATLSSVLFPALSLLQADPVRQADAFMRAARLLAFVGVPLCLLQAATIDPAMRLLFGEKWVAAIPIVQILSLASAIQLANGPGVGLLQAQGRFATVCKATAFLSVLFVILVVVGALTAQAIGVALAALGSGAVAGMLIPWLATRDRGVKSMAVANLYAVPLLVAVGAAILAVAASRLVAPGADRGRLVARLAITGAVMPATYLGGMYLLRPAMLFEALVRLRALTPARRIDMMSHGDDARERSDG